MGKVVYLRAYRSEYQSPLSAMNITPLIDVMLVLLVMLILCLPMAMHKVTVDLPSGVPTNPNPVTQKLVLTNDGVAHWNGEAVDDAALSERLRSLATVGDELLFETEGNARYERFDHLIALIKQSGVNKLGFAGNSQFAKWEK